MANPEIIHESHTVREYQIVSELRVCLDGLEEGNFEGLDSEGSKEKTDVILFPFIFVKYLSSSSDQGS